MSAHAVTELRFDPPGPGFWEQDAVHFPRPVTRYWAEMHPEPFKRGFREFTQLLRDADRHARLPIRQRLRLQDDACRRRRSEIPERFQRAEEAFEGKLWREQLREWDETFKPTSISRHRELQAVDPDALSDEELVAYLTRCRDHHIEMIYQHMRHTGAAMLPTGDFLAHVGDWTTLPPSELLGLMRGASPVSSGASAELERLIGAIAADAAARRVLESDGDAGEVLEQLRSLDGEAGVAASAYLDLVGYRLLDGFDISGRYALEMPDTLLRAIRVAVEEGVPEEADADVEARIADVRNRVPEEHRAEFDEPA